jgi:hypothetical protein
MREEFQQFVEHASSDHIENLITILEMEEDREFEEIILGLSLLLG